MSPCVAATPRPVIQAANDYRAPTRWWALMFSGPQTLGSTCHSRTSPSLAWFSHFTAWEYAKTKLHSLKEVQHQKNFHSLSLLLPRIYITNFQWKLKCPFVITWPPGTKFERSPQVGTTPGGPRAMVPSDSWGGEAGTRR